jgi:hypothetical protein
MTPEELLRETAELVPDRVVMRRYKKRRRGPKSNPQPPRMICPLIYPTPPACFGG